MPDHFTTRLQLPYPDLDDPADVPADLQQLAERLDLLIPGGAGAGLVLNRATVGDVGLVGQVRAGRQLALADFTALGLAAPVALWNLSDLADASGNARALTNKGAVTFAPGINGAATTAAQFTGSTAQALYIADAGAADPFRIRTGSWGCWLRTAKRGVEQVAVSKFGLAGARGFLLEVNSANNASLGISSDGTGMAFANGVSDVADDRWHHIVATSDGTTARLYVDGVLEGTLATGSIYAAPAPLNIGALSADGATAAGSPSFGRVDEAFVTADVLSDDQVRNLYCVRLPHGYGVVPSDVKVNVVRRRRGGAWAVADFPTQPLRLHNFTGTGPQFAADEGSQGVALAYIVGAENGAGADGARLNGSVHNGSYHQAATDTGLPSGPVVRSYGCWFKTLATTGNVMAWGQTPGVNDARFVVNTPGNIECWSGPDSVSGGFAADGQWHFVVAVEDNAASDGVRRKLYVDGRLRGASTVLTSIVLGGANCFRVGANSTGGAPFTGQIDGAFVCGVALTTAQVLALWAKGSQALAPSPKNAGDHVEGWDATSVLATFDTLDTNWQVDLGVSA
jgi:hypothetical protein